MECFAKFVLFKLLSYFSQETIGFNLTSSFASRPVLRLIRWYNRLEVVGFGHLSFEGSFTLFAFSLIFPPWSKNYWKLQTEKSSFVTFGRVLNTAMDSTSRYDRSSKYLCYCENQVFLQFYTNNSKSKQN